jgi:tetratricopeptide (TPR) repeat protein
MSFTLRISLCFLASGLTFISPTLAQSQSAPPATAAQYSADEAALRSLAEAFFFTWAAKDLDGFLRLWAPGSPNLESRKQETKKLFVDHEKIEVKKVTVYKVTIDGEKARLRVDAEINAAEAKTGKPSPGSGLRKRVMNCVRENGGWRLWSEESAFENLTKALTATATEKERESLLSDEKDLWYAELIDALNDEGRRYDSQGLYPNALNMFRAAQSVAEKINDSPRLAQSLNSIGRVHVYMANYNLALEPLQKSLRLAEAQGNQRMISSVFGNLGLLHQSQGNFKLAMEFYRKCLEMSQILGNKAFMAATLGNIGNIYRAQGNYSLASDSYQKSRGYYREVGDKRGEGRVLLSLGFIAHYQGNLNLALKFFQESLAIKQETGNLVEQARTLASLGSLYLEQGDYNKAEELIRKSLATFEASDVKADVAMSLSHLERVINFSPLFSMDYSSSRSTFVF